MAKDLTKQDQIQKDMITIRKAKDGIEQLEKIISDILEDYQKAMTEAGVTELSNELGVLQSVVSSVKTKYDYAKYIKDKGIAAADLLPYAKTSSSKAYVRFNPAKEPKATKKDKEVKE